MWLMVVLGLMALTGSGAMLWIARRNHALVDRIRRTPTSPLADVKPGLAEVTGALELVGDALTAPMTGQRCAWYELHVQEKRVRRGHNGGRDERWETVIHDEQQTAFCIDDGSGKADIDMAGARLELDADAHANSGLLGSLPDDAGEALAERYGRVRGGFIFKRDSRYTETVLAEGDTLYVLGTADTDGKRPRLHNGSDIFIISDKSERALIALLTTRARWQMLLGTALLVLGVLAFVFAPSA